MKNDFLLLKEDTLKDFREVKEKISNKYSNLNIFVNEKLIFLKEVLI